MSHSGLLATAAELSHAFYEQADAVEQARRIPPAVSRQMAEAGFYRMGVPSAIGGLESPPALSSEVFETLARGDASCAWVAFIGATSGTALASIPEAAAQAVFSRPDVLITGVFAPTGRAERVEGGFRVSGRWQWGSGSENADWVLGGCQLLENGEPILGDDGRPRTHMMILSAAEIEFLDTWHVSGLCGSGSLDYQVENVFVPETRAVGYLPRENSMQAPLYSFPNFTFLALGIGAVCMGIARAAIDELIQLAVQKKRRGANRTIAHKSSTQFTLAQSEASLRAARLLYYDALDKAWQNAAAEGEVSIEQRRDLRLATTNAVTVSATVVDEMYRLGGGVSVYRSSRLQRYFRDIHVATQHIMVSPATLETVGSHLFGLETDVSML
jgi:alkylation response protein AidB-like acyl-CoA dehydrogenase